MTNEAIERATTSTADMVAAGLEQHARAITQRVISLLGEDRAHFTKDIDDFKTMLGAIAIETQAGRRESKEGQDALIEGLRGLAQDVSVVSAAATEVARGLKKLDADVQGLNQRHGKQIGKLAKDIAAIKKVLATRPAERAAEREQMNARIEAVERRADALEDTNVRLQALEDAIAALRQASVLERAPHAE